MTASIFKKQNRRAKIVLALLIWLTTSVPPCLAWEIKYPSEEQTKTECLKVVQTYLDLVIKHYVGKTDTQKARFDLLSQEWFESLEIDQDICQLNDFWVEEYRFVRVVGNYVVVKIINRSNGWSRELKYKVIVENSVFRIQPCKFEISREVPGVVAAVKFVTPHWMAGSLAN